MTDDTVDLRVYMRAMEAVGENATWQRVIESARAYGIAEVRAIEGLIGVGSRGMIKPSNWVMRRQIPMIIELVAAPEAMNRFLSDGLGELLPSGMAASEGYAGLDREVIDAGLPNLSTGIGAMLRLVVADDESYDGTALHEAVIHVVRGLGCAGATVYRGDHAGVDGERPVIIEAVDTADSITELTRCLADIVDPTRLTSKQVAMLRWRTS